MGLELGVGWDRGKKEERGGREKWAWGERRKWCMVIGGGDSKGKREKGKDFFGKLIRRLRRSFQEAE